MTSASIKTLQGFSKIRKHKIFSPFLNYTMFFSYNNVKEYPCQILHKYVLQLSNPEIEHLLPAKTTVFFTLLCFFLAVLLVNQGYIVMAHASHQSRQGRLIYPLLKEEVRA